MSYLGLNLNGNLYCAVPGGARFLFSAGAFAKQMSELSENSRNFQRNLVLENPL